MQFNLSKAPSFNYRAQHTGSYTTHLLALTGLRERQDRPARRRRQSSRPLPR